MPEGNCCNKKLAESNEALRRLQKHTRGRVAAPPAQWNGLRFGGRKEWQLKKRILFGRMSFNARVVARSSREGRLPAGAPVVAAPCPCPLHIPAGQKVKAGRRRAARPQSTCATTRHAQRAGKKPAQRGQREGHKRGHAHTAYVGSVAAGHSLVLGLFFMQKGNSSVVGAQRSGVARARAANTAVCRLGTAAATVHSHRGINSLSGGWRKIAWAHVVARL